MLESDCLTHTSSKDVCYFDYAATTPVDARVLEAMKPYFDQFFGNASSMHSHGTRAKETMEQSRAMLAGYIGAQPPELHFTSGGTEANNLAIKGVAWAHKNKGRHIILSAIEHDCVINACRWMREQGWQITVAPVNSEGIVDVDFIEKAMTPQTVMVSVMHANNELGTIQPVAQIGKLCRERGVLFHSDACQSFGKIALNVETENIDLLTINAHKMYGPKGVGALYVRKGTLITPLLHGGGQESGLRSTTENIPGIVGFAKAAELCHADLDNEYKRVATLKENLVTYLRETFDNVYFNGSEANSLPGLLNFSFSGQEGETIRLLFLLDQLGIYVSAGSACSSNHGGSASHVLRAIGLNPFEARGGIRVSLGRFSNESHVERLSEALKITVMQMNSIFS